MASGLILNKELPVKKSKPRRRSKKGALKHRKKLGPKQKNKR